jgi:8-oxo-dGTP pyrophosphatase MutT (NUDIX family)
VAPSPSLRPSAEPPRGLAEFFELDWVKDPNSRAEILFLRRDKSAGPDAAADDRRPSSAGEAHVAFPGGRTEEGDEGGLYTGTSLGRRGSIAAHGACSAMRQTWEEIGIDLAEKDYECIGQLDDREITTSLGKRLLMILSPFGLYFLG